MHFYDRFMIHHRSLQLEDTERLNREKYMCQLHQVGLDSDYLKEAAAILFSCRLALKYSFVHAYYMQNYCEVEFFSEQQMALESNTERLSLVLKNSWDDAPKVNNQIGISKHVLRVILEGIPEGLIQNFVDVSDHAGIEKLLIQPNAAAKISTLKGASKKTK